MDDNEIARRVKELLSEQMGVPADKINMDTRLAEDLGMAGDDADEFFGSFFAEFGIDCTGFNKRRYFGPEEPVGCLGLFLLLERYETINVHQLVEIVKTGSCDVSCFNCGYNLTGNISGICPECGARVSNPGGAGEN